jgi:hypothetical protein
VIIIAKMPFVASVGKKSSRSNPSQKVRAKTRLSKPQSLEGIETLLVYRRSDVFQENSSGNPSMEYLKTRFPRSRYGTIAGITWQVTLSEA